MMIRVLFTLFIICNLSSCSEETTPNQAPKIDLFNTELISLSPLEYKFEVVASDADQDPLTYFWDFGDGTAKEGKASENHVFADGNIYQVKLQISDGNNSIERQVTVNTQIVQLSINPSLTYQEIDGFGGFGAEKVWWSSEPFYTDAYVDKIINDLGVTILRDNIPESFEPQNDNDDPNLLDLTAFNISSDAQGSDSHLGQHLPYLRAMADAGLEKLIVSVWSPPLWMKHINHRGNGINDANHPNAYSAPPYTYSPDENTNQLKIENYDEFAEYCVAYIKTIKAETGLDVYALSIQNEPIFSQFYSSCVYDAPSYRDLLKIVGKRFEDEGITTQLFGQEDVRIFDRIQSFINVINADELAREYLDIFAIHNYRGDGITASDEGPGNWAKSRAIADANNQKLWMSETSGFEGGWEGAFSLAQSIYNALKFGQINAWIFWQMSNSSDGGLLVNGQENDLYRVSKHYYRYIRPGAMQIESSSNDEDILILAYKQEQENTSTVLLLNNSRSERIIQMPNASVNYEVYQSSDTQEFQDDLSLSNGRLVLPPQSITTLYDKP